MRARTLVLSLGLLLATPPAHALPDLARGLAALERGDVAAAEADLVPLAEQGFPRAQTALARLYAQQEAPASLRKAARWYRAQLARDPAARLALARVLMRLPPEERDAAEIDTLLREALDAGDDSALPLRLRWLREHPALDADAQALAQRAAQSNDLDTRAQAIAWYREHADVPAHADALATLCARDRKALPDCYGDLLRHLRAKKDARGVDALRTELLAALKRGALPDAALERAASALASQDLPPPVDARNAYRLLRAVRTPGTETRVRMARLLIDDPTLDAQADVDALLARALDEGSPDAAMLVGRRHLSERHPQANPARGRELLEKAAAQLPAARYDLGRYYERGYQGGVDAARALEHYLAAARHGVARADLALAQMFWANRGVRVDAVNAYAFARLAQHAGVPGAQELLDELRQSLDEPRLHEAQRLAQREFDARRAHAAAPAPAATPVARSHP